MHDVLHRFLERYDAQGIRQDPLLRSYILDDQGRLRRHVNVFVAGRMVADRRSLSDAVGPEDEIYVLQALSGG